ncbi:hypothetical protein AWQ21_05120 [Picosynechococcus sp. PCC 7003]|uniref:hypothetical protein n=1 Tax=Picosynechococcus sp. PCC 7003 TaxID=374981 RepID=UPI000810EA31|nr:hypothetical protein [Picosynechococcus sp. PCC 7003]ANV83814.1 hypothetical protein AWQ21_05120 [Picosynechococcus sp. PCC 7003]
MFYCFQNRISAQSLFPLALGFASRSCWSLVGLVGLLSSMSPQAIAQVPPQLTCDYAEPPQDPTITPEMSCMLRFDAIEINGLEPLSSGLPPSRYSWFMRQAEDRTELLIPFLFRQSPTPSTLDLLVVGQNDVAIAPLFNLRISQQDWQQNPNIKQWASYYPEVDVLLNLSQPVASNEAATSPAPTNPTPETITPPPSEGQIPDAGIPALPSMPALPEVEDVTPPETTTP